VPYDAVAVPQDRHLAEGRRELVALAPFLPLGVVERDDIFLELLARLLAGEPAAHRPAGISAVADDQSEHVPFPSPGFEPGAAFFWSARRTGGSRVWPGMTATPAQPSGSLFSTRRCRYRFRSTS